jgi:hypothetical protein
MRLRGVFIAYASVVTVALIGGLGYLAVKQVPVPLDVVRIAATGLVALAAGAWMAVRPAQHGGRSAFFAAAAGWGGLYLALILALPSLSHDLANDDIAHAAAAVPGATVVAYKNYPQGFAWTLGHPIVVADFQGELATDGNRPADRFWSNEEFWRRWKSGEPLAVVMRRRALADWKAAGDSAPTAVASNRTYLVVTNVRPVPSAVRP